MMKALGERDPAPQIQMRDLEGRIVPIQDLKDWVIVYTCADRASSESLMAWQQRAGVAVAKSWPRLKVAYVNVADLKIVPSMMQTVVKPYLSYAMDKSMKILADAYREAGMNLSAADRRFFMVPDWDGKVLKEFGIPNAKAFRAWVVVDGQVKGTFRQGLPNLDGDFMALFSRIANGEQVSLPAAEAPRLRAY